jgi:integrase
MAVGKQRGKGEGSIYFELARVGGAAQWCCPTVRGGECQRRRRRRAARSSGLCNAKSSAACSPGPASRLEALWLIGSMIGLRPGELCGLLWETSTWTGRRCRCTAR